MRGEGEGGGEEGAEDSRAGSGHRVVGGHRGAGGENERGRWGQGRGAGVSVLEGSIYLHVCRARDGGAGMYVWGTL